MDAKQISLGDGNVVVNGEDEFVRAVIETLNDPDLLKKKGKAAKEALLKNHLAAERHAVIVKDLLMKK